VAGCGALMPCLNGRRCSVYSFLRRFGRRSVCAMAVRSLTRKRKPRVYRRAVEIRELPESLWPDAVTLWKEAALTRPWNDPDADLRRAVLASSSAVLAACDENGKLLGTAMVGYDGHRGWVYYLAVQSGQRRKGLGRKLMRACEAWLRDRGAPKIQLMVRRENQAVVSFYESLGYTDGEVVVLGRFLD
jgi:ribosomal protein S18 acetylase RimI-like enzyme